MSGYFLEAKPEFAAAHSHPGLYFYRLGSRQGARQELKRHVVLELQGETIKTAKALPAGLK